MPDPDAAKQTLVDVTESFAEFCSARGSASEADTRAKVIDKVLTDVCCWPKADLQREITSESGRLDYRFSLRDKPIIVVEAKREGIAFTLPVDGKRKTYKLDGALTTHGPTKQAIEQVRSYCDDHGIRYAIATNGYAWIIFRAIRDDFGWRKGHARVFPSLEYIRDNFTEFWNLLSYEAIRGGSLHEEFAASLRASRNLYRVIDRLFNADLPLRRNRLNTDLQPLIKLIFEDIADQENLDILRSCYIHTSSLATLASDLDHVITETIPQFLREEGAKPVGSDGSRSGFQRTMTNAISSSKGELFLLLGAIGSGKSTFLKRYQRATGKKALEERTLWFSVDFLKPPLEVCDMEPFVWQSVLEDIRTRYSEHECEKRKYVKALFASDIAAIQSTLLTDYKSGTHRFEQALSPYLHDWARNLSVYVPRLLQANCKRLGRKPVIFIDNVDQLSPEYQRKIFLLAQRVTRLVGSITVVALREESYYTASVQKTFTAYSSRKFHIAAPHFRRMIANRIEYALKMLSKRDPDDSLSPQELTRRQSIINFFKIVEEGILKNHKIGRFIKASCHGNMRFALEMFSTFVSSGVTDVGKMLRIYDRDGDYSVAFHEFVKSIMLGDRAYYKEEQSPIGNVFSVGSEKNSSHFTAWRIIQALLAHRGQSTPEGTGYVELSRLLYRFEDVFDNIEDFLATINRLVTRHLVETNTRSTESVEGASHVRVTSAGWYYTRYLVKAFAYLDLVLQDTPVDDSALEKRLRDSVYEVNNLVDKDATKLERVTARFARVDLFLEYLDSQEQSERARFDLDRLADPVARPIVPEVMQEYQQEKEWIDRRLRENREKFFEEHLSPQYEEEAEVLGVSDTKEDEDDQQ